MALNKIDYEATKNIPIPLGVGQTWQDLTSTRVHNTVYTNTTGRPILVQVLVIHLNTGGMVLLVDGLVVSFESAAIGSGANVNLRAVLSAVVPAGSTYQTEPPTPDFSGIPVSS